MSPPCLARWHNHDGATTALSGLALALLIGCGTGYGVCLHLVVAPWRVWHGTISNRLQPSVRTRVRRRGSMSMFRFHPQTTRYDSHNALWLGKAASLAYRDEATVGQETSAWGFDRCR